MSLAVLANHMASKGRNGDTMLVHMAPEEVRGLYALAVAQGDGLTINPETGLPEANILKRFLPTILGIGATILSGGAITPLMAGLGIGAFETVRTGDLGKGIAAGLGAYGGANIGSAFAGAGAEAIGSQAVSEAGRQAVLERAAQMGGEQGLSTVALTEPAAREAIAREAIAKASPFDRFSAGISGLTEKAGRDAFMKEIGGTSGLLKSGFSAAAPIMADAMVPTATQMPGVGRPYPFRIRPMALRQDQTFEQIPIVSIAPSPAGAASGGLMSLASGGVAFESGTTPSYQRTDMSPGMLDFAQRSEPVVRMAEGGVASFADGGKPDMRTLVESAGVKIDDAFYDPNNPNYERNQQLLRNASDLLYGNLGANTEARDWAAIMAAKDPFAAGAAATKAMYSDPKYAALNAQDLLSRGYLPEQADYTYQQMQGRVGSTYTPDWTKGTPFEGKVNTPEYLSTVRKLEGNPAALTKYQESAWKQYGGNPTLLPTEERPATTSLASSLRFGVPTTPAQQQLYENYRRLGYSDEQIKAMLPGFSALKEGGLAALADGGVPPITLPSDVGSYTPEQKGKLYNELIGKGYSDAMIRQAAGQQTDADWQALQQIAGQQRTQLPANVTTLAPEQKADLYNQYLGQGISDAQIRAAAGTQTDTDWQMLQNMAAQRESPAVSGAERTVLTSPTWRSESGLTGLAGLNSNIRNWIETNPSSTIDRIDAEANKYGVDKDDILRALQSTGGSKALQTVTTDANWRSREGLTGTLGMNRNIQLWFQDNPNFTEKQVRDEMNKWGLNEADIVRAMGLGVNDLVKYISKAGTTTGTGGGGGGGGGGGTGAGTKDLTRVTDTTPTFTLPDTKITTPTGTITGGTITGGGVSGGSTATGPIQPVPVTSIGTIPGYQGKDYTYGGTTPLKQLENAPLGTPGKVVVGSQTMQQIRDEYTRGGGRLGMPTITTPAPVLTGGSKQAYDYLMGAGAYPTSPYLAPGTPLSRPYADLVTASQRPASDFFGRKTIPTTPDRETALNVPGGGGNTAQWRNVITGETVVGTPTQYITDPTWQRVDTGVQARASGGLSTIAAAAAARGGDVQQYNLGGYSDGGRLLRGPGDGVSDSIPATIGGKQPARLADGEFVIPARIVSEIGNGSTEAGARKLYAMMDRVQQARAKTTGKGKVAKNTKADKYLPA